LVRYQIEFRMDLYNHVMSLILSSQQSFLIAVAAIVLHVVNYNSTAHLEYNTRFFTKILGSNAIYFYAVYLIISALIRDHFINNCLNIDNNSFQIDADMSVITGSTLFVFGIALNLWTLQTLGIKGMYNGDSFGFLFDAPVTGGPYRLFSDPQYVGTTAAMLGSALYYKSTLGVVLTFVMAITFWVSVTFIEGPHMTRIYSSKSTKTPSNNAFKRPKKVRAD